MYSKPQHMCRRACRRLLSYRLRLVHRLDHLPLLATPSPQIWNPSTLTAQDKSISHQNRPSPRPACPSSPQIVVLTVIKVKAQIHTKDTRTILAADTITQGLYLSQRACQVTQDFHLSAKGCREAMRHPRRDHAAPVLHYPQRSRTRHENVVISQTALQCYRGTRL